MARDSVKISKDLDANALGNAIFTSISDGVEMLSVNADGSLNATINNASLVVTATDLDIRDLSATQDNVAISDGTDTLAIDASGNIGVTDAGGSLTVDGTVAATQSGTWNIDTVTTLTGITNDVNIADGGNSITVDGTVAATQSGVWNIGTVASITADVSIDDGGNSITVDAVDLDVRDLTHVSDSVKVGDGTDLLAVNADGSINVIVSSGAGGTAIADYDQVAALASAASDNHDYTAAGGAFTPTSVSVSGESIGTFSILANAVVVATLRTSVEHPNAVYEFPVGFSIADTQVLRVTRTNDSNKAHSFESTINGSQA